MNTTITDFSRMDDLVFENRNIAYGAYSLRNKYEKHLYTGLLFTFGIFALGMGIPEFIKSLKGEETFLERPKDIGIVLDPPPVIPVNPPPAFNFPTPPPPPSARFIPTATAELVPETKDVFINAQPEAPTVSASDGNVVYDYSGGFGSEIVDISIDEPVDKPFIIVEQMPRFNGDMAKFMNENFKYPQRAINDHTEGKVFLSFVVGANGVIEGIKVLKGISKECDEEAIRVVKKMPAWIPGKQSGKAVAVHFTLPITFKLNNSN